MTEHFPNDISRYKIVEEIGHGATSEVFSAICLDNGKEVSIKKVDLEIYKIELDFLRQEVSFWSTSCHPNVVGYYGSFMSGSVIYLLMEYCAAGSLYDIMRFSFPQGFKDELLIATFLRDVLNALQYIHSNGQIHRDVKPGNVLLCADGAVKLGDFGVAASLIEQGQRQNARYTVTGTPCYMAPEVLNEDHGYTEKADIWSLGITAIELATGEAPYSRLKQMEVMIKILKSPPPTLPTNSPYSMEFRDFVKCCLQKDPKDRLTAEQLLKHPFISKAKDGDYIRNTLLSKLPPIGERLKRIKKQIPGINLDFLDMPKQTGSNSSSQSQQPQQQEPAWNFDLNDNGSNQSESVTKGRFTITKQPSSGGNLQDSNRNESNAEKERDELKQVILQMQRKMEAMSCEMEQMKDQIRLLTCAVQNMMK